MIKILFDCKSKGSVESLAHEKVENGARIDTRGLREPLWALSKLLKVLKEAIGQCLSFLLLSQ